MAEEEAPQVETKEPLSLDLETTKCLITDFEESDQPRSSFDLLGLCNNNPADYGFEGTKLGRKVQLRWSKLKRKTVDCYVRYLERLDIQLSRKRRKELQDYQQRKMVKTRNGSGSNDGSQADDDSTFPPIHGDPYNEDQDAASFHNGDDDDDDDRKPPAAIPYYGTPSHTEKKKTPSRGVRYGRGDGGHTRGDLPPAAAAAAAMFASPPQVAHDPPVHGQHVFGRVSPMVPMPRMARAFHPPHRVQNLPAFGYPLSLLAEQDGTVKRPWVVIVSGLPERNRDFNIQFVERITQDDIFSRNGFHVRRAVAGPDFYLWEATIPDPEQFGLGPEWKDRIILIKGPAQDFWLRNTQRYHSGKNKIDCPATMKAHLATSVAIDEEDAQKRFWGYYILAFGPTIELDNQIFSREEGVVPIMNNPLTLKKDDADNKFGQKFLGMTVYWRIAVRGGIKIGQQKKREDDAKDMFADDRDY